MSRYIDYDAIDYRNDKMQGRSSDFIDGVIYMAQRIEEAPTIEVVRIEDVIAIIDDLYNEGVIDYMQAWELRMRVRAKGEDDE